MKLKNILLGFITIFIMLFADTVSATTTAPNNFKVNGKDLYVINTNKYLPGGTWNFYFKKNADGQIIYCVQSHDSSVTSGSHNYTLVKEMEAKYAYVLMNGYPNKSITGEAEKDYFITAFAIYYLVDSNDYIFSNFDLEKGTYRGKESEIVKEVAKLVEGANNYSFINPSISINNDNKFTLSDDKKYYVSSNLSVNAIGTVNNYTISLENAPNGTIITDANGIEKNTFNTKEKFIIKVPVASINDLSNNFKVNASANGSINKAYLYEPDDAKYQNVITLYPDNIKVNATTEIKLNLTTKVQISKVDVTTGQELPGATLTVKDVKGNVIDTWVSTNEKHVIEGLKPGKYTLTEEIAPEGYVLSTETVEFEIKADGTVTEVVMENAPKDRMPVYISKQDITTNEELAGAHLELKDEQGNVIEAWISGTEPHIIEELKPGKYYLTEVIAPEGYELSTETIEFIVKEDGTVDGKIIMYNKPETIVEVPSTSSFKTITASLIGIMVIAFGAMIIYKNYKKNEEY